MSEPTPAGNPAPWRQIGIVLLSSIALTFVCCAGGATLVGGQSTVGAWAGALLIFAGLAAFLTLLGTVAYAIWRLLVAVVGRARS